MSAAFLACVVNENRKIEEGHQCHGEQQQSEKIQVPLPKLGDYETGDRFAGEEEIGGVLHTDQPAVLINGRGKGGIQIEGGKAEKAQKAKRREIMPGAESNLVRPVNVESQDHQHRMVEEELIGKGMRKCLRNVDAGVENRRHEQSAQGTDETGGIHKGEESRPQAAVPGKSCIEDEENLDGAQMKRQMLQLHIRIADGAVGRGHQLYDTEHLDEFREHGAGAAQA